MLSSHRARFSLHSGFNTAALAGWLHKPHVMAKEAKTQGHEGTCLRSHGWPMRVEQMKGSVSIWSLASGSGRGQGSFPNSRMLVEKRHSGGWGGGGRPRGGLRISGLISPAGPQPMAWPGPSTPVPNVSPLRLRASEFLLSENVPVSQGCKHSWCQWLKGGLPERPPARLQPQGSFQMFPCHHRAGPLRSSHA